MIAKAAVPPRSVAEFGSPNAALVLTGGIRLGELACVSGRVVPSIKASLARLALGGTTESPAVGSRVTYRLHRTAASSGLTPGIVGGANASSSASFFHEPGIPTLNFAGSDAATLSMVIGQVGHPQCALSVH